MRQIYLAGGVLLLCLCLGHFALRSDAQVVDNGQTDKWEYKAVLVESMIKKASVRDPDAMTGEIEKSLNDLGGKGWELCLEINGGLILKRPK